MSSRSRLVHAAILVALALVASVASSAHAQRRGGHSSRSSYSRSYRSSGATRSRTVHVGSYQRRSGTTERSHYRAPAGYGARQSSSYHPSRSYRAPRSAYAAPRAPSRSPHQPRSYAPRAPRRSYATAGGAARDARGRIRRSESAKRQFTRQTGYPRGRPGYVVDHIVPLACGGADAPSNMQWQTRAEAKAKDRTERIGCGRARR
jgi:hypothetical protein